MPKSQLTTKTRGHASNLQYEGETVTSRLNGEILKQVALATEGAYIPAGTKQVDMAAVYHRYIANVGKQDFESARINSYIPRFQYFVGAAILLLIIPIFLGWMMPTRNPVIVRHVQIWK